MADTNFSFFNPTGGTDYSKDIGLPCDSFVHYSKQIDSLLSIQDPFSPNTRNLVKPLTDAEKKKQDELSENSISEDCELCCPSRLIITFKRHTRCYTPSRDIKDKKGKVTKTIKGTWFATIGSMTMVRVDKSSWVRQTKDPKTGYFAIPKESGQTTIMECDFAERGGPGSDKEGSGLMVQAGTYGLSAMHGETHSTNNYKTVPRAKNYRYIAMAVYGSGSGIVKGRTGVDIHIGNSYTWSLACLILAEKGNITTEAPAKDEKSDENRGTSRPNFDLQKSYNTVLKFVTNVEKFKGKDPKTLPLYKRLGCITLIISEPKESEWNDITVS